MTAYTAGYAIRYNIMSLHQQAEYAVITAADQIKNEDPGVAGHADRAAWANWVMPNSQAGTLPFLWPIAMNPSIQANIASDPSGASVLDSDVQFVVNGNVEWVIAEWVAGQPV